MNINCPYRKNIDCFNVNTKKCENCGWNPEVAEKRIKLWKFMRRFEEEDKK